MYHWLRNCLQTKGWLRVTLNQGSGLLWVASRVSELFWARGGWCLEIRLGPPHIGESASPFSGDWRVESGAMETWECRGVVKPASGLVTGHHPRQVVTLRDAYTETTEQWAQLRPESESRGSCVARIHPCYDTEPGITLLCPRHLLHGHQHCRAQRTAAYGSQNFSIHQTFACCFYKFLRI